MVSASLLVQARRSAGLTQRELAVRAGVAQQEIARYERGRVTPSLERMRSLIAACDLELTFGLARPDASYDHQINAALALDPARRLESALRDAQPLRTARTEIVDDTAPTIANVLGILRELVRARIRYVLIGELAEVLHGSPLLPIDCTLSIVPRAGQREPLLAAIAALGGQPNASSPTSTASAIDAPASFALDRTGTQLVLEPAPPATRGYEDLRRDATTLQLGQDLDAPVASLIDLIRIAEASEDRARVPALRRTFELATSRTSAHAA